MFPVLFCSECCQATAALCFAEIGAVRIVLFLQADRETLLENILTTYFDWIHANVWFTLRYRSVLVLKSLRASESWTDKLLVNIDRDSLLLHIHVGFWWWHKNYGYILELVEED